MAIQAKNEHLNRMVTVLKSPKGQKSVVQIQYELSEKIVYLCPRCYALGIRSKLVKVGFNKRDIIRQNGEVQRLVLQQVRCNSCLRKKMLAVTVDKYNHTVYPEDVVKGCRFEKKVYLVLRDDREEENSDIYFDDRMKVLKRLYKRYPSLKSKRTESLIDYKIIARKPILTILPGLIEKAA